MAETLRSSNPSLKKFLADILWTDDAAAKDDSWGTVTATDKEWDSIIAKFSHETSVPLPTIRFPKRYCVVILTDPEGNPATIGSLGAANSPTCIIQFGSVTQNRETSIALRACFPKFASSNTATTEQFHGVGFHFYGNAFQSLESDFEINFVTELSDLHDMLAERESVPKAMTGKNLYKLQMTYKPQDVITKAKDDPAVFSMRESSHAARLFSYLVECETLTTITLYFCATHEDIDALVDIRDRLKQEKDIKSFNEYRDMNGKIVIEWGSKFGPWLDVGPRLPSQLNFRFPEEHAVTLAYGEIRDHACTVLIARSRLTTSVKISFVAIPGSKQEHEVPLKYIGFVNIEGLKTLLEVGLFKVGSKATLCFYQPLLTVEPQGWQCVVKPEIPHVEHPGTLVLIVTCPAGSEQQVNVAKYPSPDMRAESDYSVWLYPHGSDRYCKQLINCTNKILYGEEDEDEKQLLKWQCLQKFCAGFDFLSLPRPPANLFDKSKLTDEQRRKLEILEARCSEDQRAALEKIYTCSSTVNMIQGLPGTGKTTFAADILISIFEIFSLKANCYAPSNAVTDAFAGKVSLKLKPIRYHDPPKEWSIGINRVSSAEPTAETRPCDNATATLSEEQMIWIQAYNDAASSMSWNVPTELQYPNFSSRGLHVRALQRAKLMDEDGQMSDALPKDVPEAYLPWARQYYRLDERVTKSSKEGDEDKPTFCQLTLRLFDDTSRSADYVVTTCDNAADKRLRRCTNPRVVIIDEAGSARELETLMVMYHNLESADMFIIVGDANQSPVVPSLHHKLNHDDPNSPPYNVFAPQLATSLMARQIANGIRHSTFTKI